MVSDSRGNEKKARSIPFQQKETRSELLEHPPIFAHRNQRPGHPISWGAPKAERGNAQALLLADLDGIRSPTRTEF
jgi:hypothetical protein